MFTLDGKLSFVNIEQNYLNQLNKACPEVYYKSQGYDNKPYVGIMINNANRKYVVPLSSAKEKHKKWANVNKECYLIYEKAEQSNMSPNDIWIKEQDGCVKHILSALDIKKMIPIVDGTYTRVNLNYENNDTEEMKKYKDLLNKEYLFCLKIINEIIDKANKLYDAQMNTGVVLKFCCDFKVLEKVADSYKRN